jgi:hypothetical protein
MGVNPAADLAAVLVRLPTLGRSTLRVSEPLWRYWRDKYVSALRPETAQAVMGMPIVIDDDLSGGQWQLVEGGQVVRSGDIAPAAPGEMVTYAGAAVGWVAWSLQPDLSGLLTINPASGYGSLA